MSDRFHLIRSMFAGIAFPPALVMGVCLLPISQAAAAPPAFIHVNTATLTLVPSAQNYVDDFIEATGSAGIEVKVKTGDPAGLILKVRSSGTGNTILLGDLLVRTLSPPGPGGTSLSGWAPIALTDLNLWSIGVAQDPFISVQTDIRIANLGSYVDAAGGGFTSFSHTLVFTVVSP